MEDSEKQPSCSCMKLAADGFKRVSMAQVSALFLGSLVIVGLLFSYGYNREGWNDFFSFDGFASSEDAGLDDVLKRASTENKTVILTIINKAYTENDSMLELFLQGLQQGEETQPLIQHLLLVAVDQAAFNRCQEIHPHCYRLSTGGVDFSGEELFMSKYYLDMMWRRLLFVAAVVRRGYNVVFTDADILWFRNPFPRFSLDDDVQISCDRYNGRPYDTSNAINAGFYFVRSNIKTIKLYKLWYKSKDIGIHEQDVLQKLQTKDSFKKLGLKFRFLNTQYFAGFCQTSTDMREVNTMHANCCKSLKAKMADLSAFYGAWKNFTATTGHNTTTGTWPDAKACHASWG
ncbi:uncharacterized protein At1g28695-like [Nymphaea colorata]|nr:uncharacterized protein At1g28695-like [Nymphaea colorata]XP_031481986.1 uncharacterized protein At1g28695-like [Nymphaea colorata]